ncbi:MAG: hypothetical protein QM604_09100, partial [Microbacterium sp.]
MRNTQLSVPPARRSFAARLRRALSAVTVGALFGALLSVAGVVAATPASAADTLVCGDGADGDTIYVLNSVGQFGSLEGAAGSVSLIGTIGRANTSYTINALGLSSDGTTAYAVNGSATVSGSLSLSVYDIATETTTSYTLPDPTYTASTAAILRGAINPANGYYYYTVGTSSTQDVYAFNTTTNTAIGLVGRISSSTSPGDLAFDSEGNMYIVLSSTLGVVTDVPSTASASTLTMTTLVAQLGGSSSTDSNGIAFGADGYLYVTATYSSASTVLKYDPSTGDLESAVSITNNSFTNNVNDAAGCANPNTLTVVKDVDSRLNDTDQFTVSITSDDSTLASGTTTGTDTGEQTDTDEVAGPVVALSDSTYTIAETASGGADLADYTTTWECADADGDNVSSGTGTSFDYTYPESTSGGLAVTCVFTNTAASEASLSLVKSADVETVDAVGDTVTYTFTVTNTGNVTVDDIAIDETAFSGSGTLSDIECDATSLASGESTDCTATYAVTQADIDAGEITNTAVATGIDPNETTVTSNEDDAVVTAEQSAALTLVKSADVETVDAVGDTITYTFTVTNTGNVTVDDIAISETAFSGSGTLSDIECDATSLASGESTDCTATYTVTQDDIVAGEITNTAVATGTDPSEETVTSNEDDAVVTATESAALTLVKTADVETVDEAGDTITYTFTVTNSGNVTIDDIAISETAFSGSGTLSDIECDATSLASGESTDCTATYTVTQADIEAGEITNTAVATGTDPSDETVTSNEDDAVVTADQEPSLSLVKSADVAAVDAAGDTVTYTFTVTNTGNVTVDDIAISETAFSGSGTLSDIECDATSLAVNESTECTATYTVTQDDIDAGEITNTAVATGTDPSEETVTSNESDVEITADQTAGLVLVKTASVATVDEVGDSVVYTFTVTNSGNVTVDDIAIDETAFSGTGTLSDIECDATTLAPG